MKKKLLVLLVPLAMSVPAAAGAGTASAQPTVAQNPTPTFSGLPCYPTIPSRTFTVDGFELINKEKVVTTTLGNGDVVTTITGKLVMRFQNHSTGKSVVRDVSGATKEIDHTDGTGIKVGTGSNWWGFGPNGQKNTGEPGLVFTRGPVAITFANGTAQTFHLEGDQENGCALLSGHRET